MPSRVQGIDIDVGIDAALADQLQPGQAFEQGRANLGPLADQHQRLGIPKPFRQHINVLDVIVPDMDVVPSEFLETIEGAYGVEIIVENGNLHDTPLHLSTFIQA
jgi:hypothetical protein